MEKFIAVVDIITSFENITSIYSPLLMGSEVILVDDDDKSEDSWTDVIPIDRIECITASTPRVLILGTSQVISREERLQKLYCRWAWTPRATVAFGEHFQPASQLVKGTAAPKKPNPPSALVGAHFSCGIGGFSEGLESAGIEVLYGVDESAEACEVWQVCLSFADFDKGQAKFWLQARHPDKFAHCATMVTFFTALRARYLRAPAISVVAVSLPNHKADDKNKMTFGEVHTALSTVLDTMRTTGAHYLLLEHAPECVLHYLQRISLSVLNLFL